MVWNHSFWNCPRLLKDKRSVSLSGSVLAMDTGNRLLIPDTIRRIFESANIPGYSST
jgi:hypothetical protein